MRFNDRPTIRNVIAALGVAVLLTGTACRSATPAARAPQASTPAQPQPHPRRPCRTACGGFATARSTAPRCSRPIVLRVHHLGRRERPQAGLVGGRPRRGRNGHQQPAVSNRTRARRGLPYSSDSWRAWVARREATPLPGAAAFLARVHDLGGRIAIVTNRLGIGVPGYGSGFQGAPTGVRRDAVPARRELRRQEPALRGRGRRDDESRRTAARRRRVRRRQHPRLPEPDAGGRQGERGGAGAVRGRSSSCCPIRCTEAGSSDGRAAHLGLSQVLLRRARDGPAELRRLDPRCRHARWRGRGALRRVLPELRRAGRGAGDGGDGRHRTNLVDDVLLAGLHASRS